MKIKLSELKKLISEQLIIENLSDYKDKDLKKWAIQYGDEKQPMLFFTMWMDENTVKKMKKLVDEGKNMINTWATKSNLKEKLKDIKNNKKGWKLFDYDKNPKNTLIEIIIYK